MATFWVVGTPNVAVSLPRKAANCSVPAVAAVAGVLAVGVGVAMVAGVVDVAAAAGAASLPPPPHPVVSAATKATRVRQFSAKKFIETQWNQSLSEDF